MFLKISSSRYKSTMTALQLFLSKVEEGGCLAKASLQYTLQSEESNLECFQICLAALIENLQDQLKSLQREATKLSFPRGSTCFPTALDQPSVPECTKSLQKYTEESCGVKTVLRIEGTGINSTENFGPTPTPMHNLHMGAPLSCIYSSNQAAVIDPTEEMYRVASDTACKNSAQQMHLEESLPGSDGANVPSITAAVNCRTNVSVVSVSQCSVAVEQHSLGTSGLSYNNVSSLSELSIPCHEPQIFEPENGSDRNSISPRGQLPDTVGSSENVVENTLPVALTSSSYPINFEASNLDPTPSVPVEIPPNDLFNSAVHIVDPSMAGLRDKFNSNDLDMEPLKSLPFLCCRICTNVFLHLEAFSRHACKSLELASEKSIAQNLIRSKNKLDELKKFTCSICGIELRSVRRMAYHLPRCRPGPYCCGVCAMQFEQRPALHRHVKTQHRCTSCHACEECGKKFERLTSLQKHMVLQHENASAGGPYRCDACPKKFIRRIYLTNHKLRMHQLAKPFTCELCGSGLLTAASLAVHRRCVHGSATERYPCSHCGKTFSRKEKLLLHLRRHTGERPFACEVCSRGFVSKSKLQEHTTRQHLPQHTRRRHPCALCHKTYANRADLRKHSSRVHGARKDDSGGATDPTQASASDGDPATTTKH